MSSGAVLKTVDGWQLWKPDLKLFIFQGPEIQIIEMFSLPKKKKTANFGHLHYLKITKNRLMNLWHLFYLSSYIF